MTLYQMVRKYWYYLDEDEIRDKKDSGKILRNISIYLCFIQHKLKNISPQTEVRLIIFPCPSL
jgi:hypothetical protein